jgi:hypothetical protein
MGYVGCGYFERDCAESRIRAGVSFGVVSSSGRSAREPGAILDGPNQMLRIGRLREMQIESRLFCFHAIVRTPQSSNGNQKGRNTQFRPYLPSQFVAVHTGKSDVQHNDIWLLGQSVQGGLRCMYGDHIVSSTFQKSLERESRVDIIVHDQNPFRHVCNYSLYRDVDEKARF